jgi:hypothetical protein
MIQIPPIISSLFGLLTLAVLMLFYRVVKNSNVSKIRSQASPIFIGLAIWTVLQGVLAYTNVYNSDLQTLPPKIALFGILPAFFTIVGLFLTPKSRAFIDSLPLKNLTWLHIVRVPVEFGLYFLAAQKMLPELLTFEGRNFDIFAGLTAPFVAYFGVTKGKMSRRALLIWNLLCLGLLLNIVFHAFLSVPSPLQKFGFDQPNLAVLNFPVSWLPTIIVPLVLFSHLAALRQLLKR